MTPNELYFRWLCEWVDGQHRYGNLLACLDSIPFIVLHPMDENRASDGKYMRYIYYDATGNDSCRNNEDCTVLEMFIGLAWRLSYDVGNIKEDWGGDQGVAPWFWTMIHNLGLDGTFNIREVKNKVEFFMYRNYDFYGHGGPFIVNNPCKDMRESELWDQANWYLAQERSLNF